MMKTKKMFAVLMAARLESHPFPPAGKKDAQTTSEAGIQTISIWTANAHSKNAYNEAIAEWNETKGKELGVKLVYEVKEGDLTQQIDLAIQTGQAPDLFSGNVQKLAADGHIMAINDLPRAGRSLLRNAMPESTRTIQLTNI